MQSNLTQLHLIRSKKGIMRCVISLAVVTSLMGCANFRGPAFQMAKNDSSEFNKPLRASKPLNTKSNNSAAQYQDANPKLDVIKPPSLSVAKAKAVAEEMVLPQLKDSTVSKQTYNNLPLPVFINEAFGNQLQLDFIIQPSVRSAQDLVTLRLNSLLSQKDFYVLVTRTLANYGVTVFEQDGVLVFDYSADASNESTPMIITGETLPEVPSESRPIFYIYPLKALRTPQVTSLLKSMFPSKELTITEEFTRNALILSGRATKVKQATEVVKMIDVPAMSGYYNVILQPRISSVDEMMTNLEQILTTEGFYVRGGDASAPIKLLPLESTGQLVVFTKSQEVLDYIVSWAGRLESQRQEEVTNGVFTYQVNNTQADHIVALLSELGIAQGGFARRADGESSSGTTSTLGTGNANDNVTGRFAVDDQLNTILFSGSGNDWVKALSMIEKLDRPAPSVMIEVILAEVSLEESEESAIEWLIKAAADRFDIVGSTLGSLGVSGGGFSLNLSNSGQTRAALNFLYDNSRSTIRSRPRLMVKSGEEASINIGDRVPIITQTSTSTNSEFAPVIQNVSYQETGVSVDVKPIVHASGMVDIELSQELSEAVNTDSSAINSPTIRTRNISTSLSLRDGGSVLIGGLIRSNDSDGERGVPVLGKLPVLGNLFKGENSEVRRTELMIMVIPYILNSPDEAEALVDELQTERIKELYVN